MLWSASLVVIVVFLALVHVALGWLLGRHRPRLRAAAALGTQPDAQELRQVAQQLAEEVMSVTRDISQHHSEIQQVHRGLEAACSKDDGALADSVLASVAEILRINARLQNQLLAAEGKLHEQDKQIESWMAEARTDPLTGLANRRAFDDALQRQVAEWHRKKTPFSVLVIDVDHFKNINDQHGHPVGDVVLRRIAEVLGSMLRRMDVIARIGGEEFAAILPGTVGIDACRAAEHCRLAIASRQFRCNELHLRVSICLGVASVHVRDDGSSLVARADRALYAAKQAGRNCVYLHNGQTCEPANPTTPGETAAASESQERGGSSTPEGQEDSELAALNDLLRNRLAEIIEGPV